MGRDTNIEVVKAAGCQIAVTDGELTVSGRRSPELADRLAVLHTGVRAVLTGRSWHGIDAHGSRAPVRNRTVPSTRHSRFQRERCS